MTCSASRPFAYFGLVTTNPPGLVDGRADEVVRIIQMSVRLAPSATMLGLGGATEASIWSVCHRLDARRYARSVPSEPRPRG